MLEKWRNGLKKLLAAGNKETMLILFLSGILIFVILLPTERKESTPRKRYQQRKSACREYKRDREYLSKFNECKQYLQQFL